MRTGALLTLPLALALAGCTATAVSGVATFGPSAAVWAVDREAEACANTRAGGVVLGDPGAFAGVPLVGGLARAGSDVLEAEATCRVVRTFGPTERARIRAVQASAARSGSRAADGFVAVVPRRAAGGCVALATTHLASGRVLAPERLCPDGRGGFVPELDG